MNHCLRLAALAAGCASLAVAVDWQSLRRQGCVNDFAGVLDSGSKRQLEDYCGNLERAGGARLQFVIVPSLEREPLDDVASTLFASWSAPGAPPDRRVLFLLSTSDRRCRVESGGRLPRGLTASVLREAAPALRQRRYDEALKAAAEAIARADAKARRVAEPAPLARRMHASFFDALPWEVLAGALILALWLVRGYGTRGFGAPGTPRRVSWGGRGGGGFGGYDSGDGQGGFSGAASQDW